jgi:hypothetical protein
MKLHSADRFLPFFSKKKKKKEEKSTNVVN